jgi:hypothetical protein
MKIMKITIYIIDIPYIVAVELDIVTAGLEIILSLFMLFLFVTIS